MRSRSQRSRGVSIRSRLGEVVIRRRRSARPARPGPPAGSSARAPVRPRSGNGISIVSKSRGRTVARNTARASSRRTAGGYRLEKWVSASIVTLGLAGQGRGLAGGRVLRLGGALELLLGERRLVDQQVGPVSGHPQRL